MRGAGTQVAQILTQTQQKKTRPLAVILKTEMRKAENQEKEWGTSTGELSSLHSKVEPATLPEMPPPYPFSCLPIFLIHESRVMLALDLAQGLPPVWRLPMNLREQLRHILPQCLPKDPSEAVKGTELIRLVRLRLEGDYSDATLRYHFSILSYDPGSPIAKVDQGQGYYQRQTRRPGAVNASLQGWFDRVDDVAAAAWLRFDRVLAIYERLCLTRSRFPFILNGRSGGAPETEGGWEVPDLVVADWDLDGGDGEVRRLDQPMLRLRRHLGVPEVGLAGVQLKLTTSLETYAADFFQALSATRWATEGELVIAEAVTDEALVDALRQLGHEFGIGIVTLGLDQAGLDGLPLPDEIRDMDEARFDAVQGRLRVQRLTPPTPRAAPNWTLLSRLREKYEGLHEMTRWLGDCLDDGRPDWRRMAPVNAAEE